MVLFIGRMLIVNLIVDNNRLWRRGNAGRARSSFARSLTRSRPSRNNGSLRHQKSRAALVVRPSPRRPRLHIMNWWWSTASVDVDIKILTVAVVAAHCLRCGFVFGAKHSSLPDQRAKAGLKAEKFEGERRWWGFKLFRRIHALVAPVHPQPRRAPKGVVGRRML